MSFCVAKLYLTFEALLPMFMMQLQELKGLLLLCQGCGQVQMLQETVGIATDHCALKRLQLSAILISLCRTLDKQFLLLKSACLLILAV